LPNGCHIWRGTFNHRKAMLCTGDGRVNVRRYLYQRDRGDPPRSLARCAMNGEACVNPGHASSRYREPGDALPCPRCGRTAEEGARFRADARNGLPMRRCLDCEATAYRERMHADAAFRERRLAAKRAYAAGQRTTAAPNPRTRPGWQPAPKPERAPAPPVAEVPARRGGFDGVPSLRERLRAKRASEAA
jgi:hypothetical protein